MNEPEWEWVVQSGKRTVARATATATAATTATSATSAATAARKSSVVLTQPMWGARGEVPKVFGGLLDSHLKICRQVRAAQGIVGRGAAGKEFKQRRQRDLGRYGEQQQVQDVVAPYECIPRRGTN